MLSSHWAVRDERHRWLIQSKWSCQMITDRWFMGNDSGWLMQSKQWSKDNWLFLLACTLTIKSWRFFRQLSGCKLFDISTCFTWVICVALPHTAQCEESIGLLILIIVRILWRAKFVSGQCWFYCRLWCLAHSWCKTLLQVGPQNS